jgi:fatty acid desaturase
MRSEHVLKARIRAELPAEVFAPRPWRALWALPLAGSIAALSATLVVFHLPWYLALAGAFLLGNLYGSFFFFGHEMAHGGMLRSRRAQDGFLFLTFLVYGLSPHLWRVWHHQAHHAHANLEDRDPDNFGTLAEFLRTPATRFFTRFAPGSRHWLSALYLFSFFTVHTQSILWKKSHRPEFVRLHRRRAEAETGLMMAFWLALGTAIGPQASLYVIVLPMMGANFVILSYIVTNHMMRPLSPHRDTLGTTMSVTTLGWLDRIHFHFSHHVEHHLFPTLSTCYAPLIRARLLELVPDRYLAPPHIRALCVLFASPRVYDGEQALVEPYTGRRVSIPQVEAALRRECWESLQPVIAEAPKARQA